MFKMTWYTVKERCVWMCNLPEITLYTPKGRKKNNVVETLRNKTQCEEKRHGRQR